MTTVVSCSLSLAYQYCQFVRVKYLRIFAFCTNRECHGPCCKSAGYNANPILHLRSLRSGSMLHKSLRVTGPQNCEILIKSCCGLSRRPFTQTGSFAAGPSMGRPSACHTLRLLLRAGTDAKQERPRPPQAPSVTNSRKGKSDVKSEELQHSEIEFGIPTAKQGEVPLPPYHLQVNGGRCPKIQTKKVVYGYGGTTKGRRANSAALLRHSCFHSRPRNLMVT